MPLIDAPLRVDALSLSFKRFATNVFGIGTAVPTATRYATTADFSERLREFSLPVTSWLCDSRIFEAISVGISGGAGGTKKCRPVEAAGSDFAGVLDDTDGEVLG